MDKPKSTIKIYKRRNEAGGIIGWRAEIKIPCTSLWASVCDCNFPTDYYGSIYPTKDAAIEAAKADIIARCDPALRTARGSKLTGPI
jgi:hypothetical protein